MSWDADIAALKLSDVEKNGLQVFRNYQRAFDKKASERFAEALDAERYDISNIAHVLDLIRKDDFRLVPIIACAFMDDLLKEAFATLIDGRGEGRSKDLLGPIGPFGDLAKRLMLAKIFDVVSVDLVDDFDRLRKARNKIAHGWQQAGHEELLAEGDASRITAVEQFFGNGAGALEGERTAISTLRVRAIWLTARAAYEVPLYGRAKAKRLNPVSALYGEPHLQRLRDISAAAQRATAGAFLA